MHIYSSKFPTHSYTKAVTRCSKLLHAVQLTATHCNTLQHTEAPTPHYVCENTATHCNALYFTATHCITLHHAASRYNTLRRQRQSKHLSSHLFRFCFFINCGKSSGQIYYQYPINMVSIRFIGTHTTCALCI